MITAVLRWTCFAGEQHFLGSVVEIIHRSLIAPKRKDFFSCNPSRLELDRLGTESGVLINNCAAPIPLRQSQRPNDRGNKPVNANV